LSGSPKRAARCTLSPMYPDRDLKIITALNQTWDRLNTVSGSRLPKVEWYLTAGRDSACAAVWDTTPVVLRMNLQERTSEVDADGRPVYRNRKPEDILTQLAHLAAHASMRSEPSAGAEGRYHSAGNGGFADEAEKLGLAVAQPGDSRYNFGTGHIPLPWTEQPKLAGKYAAYLRRIDAALQTWEPERARKDSRSPQSMRCACTVDTILAGMAKRGVRPTTQPPTAPKVINASSGVRERGGIVCADCGAEFA
jgi:hypothetical protein